MTVFIMTTEDLPSSVKDGMEKINGVPQRIRKHGMDVYQGRLGAYEAAVIMAGCGKGNAAKAAQTAVYDLGANVVVNVGTATATGNSCAAGDIFIVEELWQYDVSTKTISDKRDTRSLYEYDRQNKTAVPCGTYTAKNLATVNSSKLVAWGKNFLAQNNIDMYDFEYAEIIRVCEIAKVPSYSFKIIANPTPGQTGGLTVPLKDIIERVNISEIVQRPGSLWHKIFSVLSNDGRYKKLNDFLNDAYKKTDVYPAKTDIYNCFGATPLEKVKCVILGLDPYNKESQHADGLCFSSSGKVTCLRSLNNLLNELKDEDPDFKIPNCGKLTKWADEGVLLLNCALTVRDSSPRSHLNEWEWFINEIIAYISYFTENVVFILFGEEAAYKVVFIDREKHDVIFCIHPAHSQTSTVSIKLTESESIELKPLSDARPFSSANTRLKEKGIHPINWKL